LTVPRALIARDQTGNFISASVRASRAPASMTRPSAPRARNDVARRSPNIPSSFCVVTATTTTSPGWMISAATCSIQLSPGWASTVKAVPQTLAPGQTGRMYGCRSPVRFCASCTVAEPDRPSRSTIALSARATLRTTIPVV
jgi:hypothetical protein